MKNFLLLIALFLISFTLNAQKYNWEYVDVPSRYPLTGLAEFSDGTLIATSNTIATSTDGGVTWEKGKEIKYYSSTSNSNDDDEYYNNLITKNNGFSYLLMNGRLIYSTNKGETWTVDNYLGDVNHLLKYNDDVFVTSSRFIESILKVKKNSYGYDVLFNFSDSLNNKGLAFDSSGNLYSVRSKYINKDIVKIIIYLKKKDIFGFKKVFDIELPKNIHHPVYHDNHIYVLYDSSLVRINTNDYSFEIMYKFMNGSKPLNLQFIKNKILIFGSTKDKKSFIKVSEDLGFSWKDVDLPVSNLLYSMHYYDSFIYNNELYMYSAWGTYKSKDLDNWESVDLDKVSNPMIYDLKFGYDNKIILHEEFSYKKYIEKNNWEYIKTLYEIDSKKYFNLFIDSYYNIYRKITQDDQNKYEVIDSTGRIITLADNIDLEFIESGNLNNLYFNLIDIKTNNNYLYRRNLITEEFEQIYQFDKQYMYIYPFEKDNNIYLFMANHYNLNEDPIIIKLDQDNNILSIDTIDVNDIFKSHQLNIYYKANFSNNTLFLQTDSLRYSRDFGKTWSILPSPSYYARYILTDNDIITLTNKGIYISDLININWIKLFPYDYTIKDIKMDYVGRLYVITSRGLYRTTEKVTTVQEEKPVEEEGGISIYPNPAGESATILLDEAPAGEVIVEIYNITGIKVLEFSTISKETELDLSALSQGNYIIKVDSGGKMLQGKVSVVR